MIRKAAYFVREKKNSQAESIFLQGIAQYPKVPQISSPTATYLACQKQISTRPRPSGRRRLQSTITTPMRSIGWRSSRCSQQKYHRRSRLSQARHAVLRPMRRALRCSDKRIRIFTTTRAAKDACSKSFELQRTPETLGCIAGADFELKNYKEAAQIFDVLDNNAKGFLDQNPQLLYVAGKSYDADQPAHEGGSSAYKRLLPMMKKGTKDYTQIQGCIADLSKPAPTKP